MSRLFTCLAGIIAVVAIAGGAGADEQDQGRIVVLGFDGMDPLLAEKWIAAGQLPNFKRLAAMGGFYRLATSNPAQSPVAWSTFATGKNPGKHNIYGFLKRGDGEYHPRLGLAEVQQRPLLGGVFGKLGLTLLGGLLAASLVLGGARLSGRNGVAIKITATLIAITTISGLATALFWWLPAKLPWPVSLKHGPSLWSISGNHGVKTVVLGAPIAFPAETVAGGRLLCGFGVPDIAGTNGLWFKYSTRFEQISPTETGGWRMPLVERSGIWHGEIFGPRDLLAAEERQRLRRRLAGASLLQIRAIQNRLADLDKQRYLRTGFEVQRIASGIELKLGRQTRSINAGAWSDWLPVVFHASPLLTLTGMVRVRVLATHPPELYITPVQFHPQHLPWNVALSYPGDYAAQLARRHGLYPTLGWAAATNPLKDEEISEEVLWEDLQYLMRRRTQLLTAELAQKDWRLLLAFFYVPDRASHMYWRFIDPRHPRHGDAQRYPQFRNCLLDVYRWADSVVAKVLAKIERNDTLLVLSDHGFASFRWEVNLNTWLRQNGYLVMKSSGGRRLQVNDLYEAGSLGKRIDWQRTRAYAIGLGKIFINCKDRDPQGIVPQGAPYRQLCTEIAARLSELRHQGEKVIARVYRRDQIYHGPYLDEAPDLVVGFCRGYRVSWQTTLGGVSPQLVQGNTLKWSGDHCSLDPAAIPGVLFTNRRLHRDNPRIQDLAPSILTLLKIAPPADMDGQSLFAPRSR